MFPYTQKTVLVDFIASFCDGLIGLGALSVWLHPAFGVALILPRLVPHFFTSGAAGRGVRGPHQQAPHHPPAGLPGGHARHVRGREFRLAQAAPRVAFSEEADGGELGASEVERRAEVRTYPKILPPEGAPVPPKKFINNKF